MNRNAFALITTSNQAFLHEEFAGTPMRNESPSDTR